MKRKIMAMFLAFTMIFGSIGTVFAEGNSETKFVKDLYSSISSSFNNTVKSHMKSNKVMYYAVLDKDKKEADIFIRNNYTEMLLKDIDRIGLTNSLLSNCVVIPGENYTLDDLFVTFQVENQKAIDVVSIAKQYPREDKEDLAEKKLKEEIISKISSQLNVDADKIKVNNLIGKELNFTFQRKDYRGTKEIGTAKFKVTFHNESNMKKYKAVVREQKDGKLDTIRETEEFIATKANAKQKAMALAENYANKILKGYQKVNVTTEDKNGIEVAYYDFKEPDAPSGKISVTWRLPNDQFNNYFLEKSFENKAEYLIKNDGGYIFSMTFLYPKGTNVDNIKVPEDNDMGGTSTFAFNGWEPEVKGILNKDTVYTADIIYKGADPVKPNIEAKDNGSVEITLPRKNGSVRTIHVTYIPEGSKQAVTVVVTRDEDYKWKTTNKDIEVNEKTGKIIIPGNKVANETEVVAWTENYERKKSEAVKVKAKIPTKPEGDRISGKNRVETAIKISKDYFGSAETVIVVDASNFPDAMTASVLAKQLKAPILLTNSKKLDSRVEAEIKRLGASDVIIVGGNSSVSEAVRRELAEIDTDGVERIHGKDRYETSAKVAKEVVDKTGNLEHAVIASGEVFADALTVGPYAAREGYPILLVREKSLPKSVSDAITELDIKQVSIAGGTSSVSKGLESSLPTVYERLSGKNRYETAMDIAVNGIKKSDEIFVANGEQWMDALVIGPVGGMLNMPILLTGANSAPQSLKDYIAKAKVEKLTAVGGTNMISEKVFKELTK